MKKLEIEWSKLYPFLKENNINAFSRMGVCYPNFGNGSMDKRNPFTIFYHQRNHGGELGFQKEGIQMNLDGNPDNLDFNIETIFV